ncbi:MAG: SitA5 family polymorphic toxin, partial [Archangium sp.]
GGDCLGLFEDGPYLRADDRCTLALALAFGSVLEETREALGRELSPRALVATCVWTVSLYLAAWLVPEPTTKALAGALTVILVAWLGLDTVWGLLDGWALLVTRAHEAATFAELREAGGQFGKVLGTDAARALIMAVGALTGRTLGAVAARVKSLPGFDLAGAQWEAQQGGAAVMAPVAEEETALAQEGALAQAVAEVETVTASPQGALAVVLLKKKGGGGAGAASGSGSSVTVIRHRGGNQQVVLANGQRWHLPRGMSLADIPVEDPVGDQLQEAVTRAAKEWGPDELSDNEKDAIEKALERGKYWLARLLEREARGRFVQKRVSDQFKHLYDFSLNKGVDVEVPGGYKYEILSGTESNLARHGRRMAGEFFRMLTF